MPNRRTLAPHTNTSDLMNSSFQLFIINPEITTNSVIYEIKILNITCLLSVCLFAPYSASFIIFFKVLIHNSAVFFIHLTFSQSAYPANSVFALEPVASEPRSVSESYLLNQAVSRSDASSHEILTISPAGGCVSSFSRRLERSYPLNASSKKSVSSAVVLSSAPKKWNDSDVCMLL